MSAFTHIRGWVVGFGALLVAVSCGAVAGTSHGASATSTITVTVASATNIDASACAAGTANVTDMGTMLPSQSSVTTGDCSVTFGSSNDTSQLRIAQSDGLGLAMWRPPTGALDTTFDTDGMVSTAFSTGDYGRAIVTQTDGKIVVAGYTDTAGNLDIAIARYDTNGALDTSFSTDGKQTTAIGAGADDSMAVALQADGKIIVAGSSYNGSNTEMATVRYNTDGSLDTSYSGDGIQTVAIGTSAMAYGVAIQPDGKVLLAGNRVSGGNADFAVARLTSAGNLDTTFDSDGIQTTSLGADDYGTSITLQADGKIVLGGRVLWGADHDFAAVRYNADGSLDTSFSGDGKVVTSLSAGADDGNALALQTDGKVIVAGSMSNGANSDFGVVRYLADGSLDTSFSGDGMHNVGVLATNDWGYAVRVQSDGNILIAGTTTNGNNDSTAVRLTPAGNLDTTFDQDGKWILSTGGSHDEIRAIAVQTDGRIITGGSTSGGPWRFSLVALASTPVADYVNAATDWDQGTNMFGACLRAVAGGASAQWTSSATCPTTDGAYWNTIPATATKIAYASSAGTTAATASLRFGMRTSTSQPPGTYLAPITLDVLAPNT